MSDKRNFDRCNFGGAVNLGGSSPVRFDIPDDAVIGSTVYFACKYSGHCTGGQKLALTVVEAETRGVIIDGKNTNAAPAAADAPPQPVVPLEAAPKTMWHEAPTYSSCYATCRAHGKTCNGEAFADASGIDSTSFVSSVGAQVACNYPVVSDCLVPSALGPMRDPDGSCRYHDTLCTDALKGVASSTASRRRRLEGEGEGKGGEATSSKTNLKAVPVATTAKYLAMTPSCNTASQTGTRFCPCSRAAEGRRGDAAGVAARAAGTLAMAGGLAWSAGVAEGGVGGVVGGVQGLVMGVGSLLSRAALTSVASVASVAAGGGGRGDRRRRGVYGV